jgi:enoyl-CoA hydratase/carnithine racemase
MIADPEPNSPDVRRSDEDGVVTLTFTRDRKLNALSGPMLGALRDAVRDLAANDDLRALVITAEGRYFSAGIDMASLDPDPGLTEEGEFSGLRLRSGLRALHDLLDSLERIEKPVIHAAQGPCLGLGLEIAVSCDFRLASTRTSYSLPEIPKLGVLAGSGGISRLTRLVGPHWARWIAMASRPVSADQALQIGLVHEVHPETDFAGAVKAFAAELTRSSREALALAKVTIDAAVGADRESARSFDRVANTMLIAADQRAAVAALRSQKDI